MGSALMSGAMPQFQKTQGRVQPGKTSERQYVKPDFNVQQTEQTVWIGNLAKGTTEDDLMALMGQVGNCNRVQIFEKKRTGLAYFSSAEEAAVAASMSGSVLNGQ